MPAYVLLALAIVSEIIGTLALKPAAGFTRLGPSLIVALAYGIAFFLLSRVVGRLPMGMVYAIWSGSGIVLVALAAWAIYGQRPDAAGVLGMTLIVAGVLVLNLFSRTSLH